MWVAPSCKHNDKEETTHRECDIKLNTWDDSTFVMFDRELAVAKARACGAHRIYLCCITKYEVNHQSIHVFL